MWQTLGVQVACTSEGSVSLSVWLLAAPGSFPRSRGAGALQGCSCGAQRGACGQSQSQLCGVHVLGLPGSEIYHRLLWKINKRCQLHNIGNQ